jgi:hypothetical protein
VRSPLGHGGSLFPIGSHRRFFVGGLCKFDKNMTEVTGAGRADRPRRSKVRRLIVAAPQELLLHDHDSSRGNEK